MLSKNPSLLDQAANRLYIEAMKEAAPESYLPFMATPRTATGRVMTSPIAGSAPKFELQNQHDPMKFSPMLDDVVNHTMKRYGAGVEIHEDDWEDDQLGAFPEKVQEMGREAVLLPNALLIAAITSGETGQSWDGVSFFNATHPAKQQRAAFSNIVTQTGTTAAATRTDVETVIEAFLAMRSLNGRPAGTRLNRLCFVAPTTMRAQILEATNPNSMIANTASLAGLGFDYIFDPDMDLSHASRFAVLNSSHVVKAFVIWQRRAARLVAETANSGAGFVNGVRRYKGDWRGSIEYGLPERAIYVK